MHSFGNTIYPGKVGVMVWKKMVPKGSGTITECGLVEVGVVLLEGVHH